LNFYWSVFGKRMENEETRWEERIFKLGQSIVVT